jgi:threonine dehydratase
MNADVKRTFNEANSFFGGFTYPSPVQEIDVNGNKVFLKRDDLLQLGCSKQRSLPYSIYTHFLRGERKFVVSSSGNAALVSAFCAMQSNLIEKMFVLLADSISDTKLQKFIDHLDLDCELEDMREEGFEMDNIRIKLVQNPKQEAFNYSKLGFINLRGSIDDSAICGFESISDELITQIGSDIDQIFVASSSGTTALGIHRGFEDNNLKPQIHIVQTSRVHALVKNLLDKDSKKEDSHPAESIVDIVGHRRNEIEEIIKETGGNGWLITADEAAAAKAELEGYGIYTSFDSALTFAAYIKSSARTLDGKSILVFTG